MTFFVLVVVVVSVTIWSAIHAHKRRAEHCLFLCAVDAQSKVLASLRANKLAEAEQHMEGAERLFSLVTPEHAKMLGATQEVLRTLIHWHKVDQQLRR